MTVREEWKPYLALGCNLGVEAVSRHLVADGSEIPSDRWGTVKGGAIANGRLRSQDAMQPFNKAHLWRRDPEPSGAEKPLIELQSAAGPSGADVSSRRKKVRAILSAGVSDGIAAVSAW